MADIKTESSTDVYDLAEIRFGDTVIPANSFKIESKIKLERQTVTNSYTGAGWKLSEEEYSWEISEVLPEYAHILEARFQEQKSDKHGLTISAYNFQEDGDYTEAATLYSCLIEYIDYEQDSGAKFSVKGEALTKKVKK